MIRKHSDLLIALLFCTAIITTGCTTTTNTAANDSVVRVGYFPNLTHATALVGIENGTFQEYLGDAKTIETKTFNAGTEEMEALFAGEIDFGYIGPSPAVNGYIKSQGSALQVIAGATANGVTVVGTPELAEAFQAQGAEALRGMRIATPSLGNTQDVALRAYLTEHNILDEVEIIPLANADQLTAFSQGEIDGAWAPEPWASRLMQEAGAELLFTEETLWPNGTFATTLLVVRTEFLEQNPDTVTQWLKAHVAVTDWINQNPTEAQTVVNTALEGITGKKLADEVLTTAWERIIVTTDPMQETVITSANKAEELGFIESDGLELTTMFNTQLLNEISR